MKNLLPMSKAKTAYGLLSEVVKLVLEEPKRMRMGLWGGDMDSVAEAGLTDDETPVCGTVGCIGGWVEFLAREQGVREPAQVVLGFDMFSDPTERLFFGPLTAASDQGTPAHARKVVRLIKAFQRKHRVRLLKTRIVR